MLLRTKKRFLMFALLAFGVMGVAFAADTPTTLAGATVVNAKQVKGMMAKGVPVIDARVMMEYAEAHIKGAVSDTYHEKSGHTTHFDASKDRFDVGKLPSDKSAPIVFYCNGPECWKSYKASTTAIKDGYTKVYWFRGGFPAWRAAGYPTE